MNETLHSRHRIRALAVWGLARYLSITETPQNLAFLRVGRGETFLICWYLKARARFEAAIYDFPSRHHYHCTRAYARADSKPKWYNINVMKPLNVGKSYFHNVERALGSFSRARKGVSRYGIHNFNWLKINWNFKHYVTRNVYATYLRDVSFSKTK